MNDYDIDVEDCRKKVEEAKKEIDEAIKWHQKMEVWYAEAIIAREKNKV